MLLSICVSSSRTVVMAIVGGNGSHLPTGVCRQIHFGSQCATESVYRYLPAKVKLTKFHFGKPPSVESAVRHPLCQSELAELQRVCKYTLKVMPSTVKRRNRNMQQGTPCFFVKLIPCIISYRDSSSGVLVYAECGSAHQCAGRAVCFLL